MFVAWRGGRILVWRFVSKRTQGDALDPSLVCNVVHVAAARFEGIQEMFAGLPTTGPLFPHLTSAKLNAFVRGIAGKDRVPASFVVRAHGERVSASIDHRVLGVDEDDTNVAFWWKRVKRSTAFYYSGTNCETLMRVCEARFRVTVRHLAPGFFDAVVDGPMPDWKAPMTAPAEALPPVDTVITQLDAAWAAELPETGGTTPAPQRIASPVHPGIDASTLPDAPPEGGASDSESDFEGACARCARPLPIGSQALLCNRRHCEWALCTTCEPNLTRNIYCPAHTTTKRR
jgi:hypothetical protein